MIGTYTWKSKSVSCPDYYSYHNFSILIKTDGSTKFLKMSLTNQSFVQPFDEREQSRDSKVNLLLNITPRPLKESLVVKGIII